MRSFEAFKARELAEMRRAEAELRLAGPQKPFGLSKSEVGSSLEVLKRLEDSEKQVGARRFHTSLDVLQAGQKPGEAFEEVGAKVEDSQPTPGHTG